jgi:hypothetical protein
VFWFLFLLHFVPEPTRTQGGWGEREGDDPSCSLTNPSRRVCRTTTVREPARPICGVPGLFTAHLLSSAVAMRYKILRRRRARGYTPVEREVFVRAFSPGSTLEPGLKTFCRRGPKCHECSPILVPVDNTTHDKRLPFSLGSCYEP